MLCIVVQTILIYDLFLQLHQELLFLVLADQCVSLKNAWPPRLSSFCCPKKGPQIFYHCVFLNTKL